MAFLVKLFVYYLHPIKHREQNTLIDGGMNHLQNSNFYIKQGFEDKLDDYSVIRLSNLM